MINSFAGESRHILDEKGRVSIPAKFRRWLNNSTDYVFVLTKGSDPCLVAYPFLEWDHLANKLLELSAFNTKNRAFVRAICREATRLRCDKQGRISIPQTLLDYAKIRKEVIIIGALNRIELWAPELLNQHEVSQYSPSDSYFEDLGNIL